MNSDFEQADDFEFEELNAELEEFEDEDLPAELVFDEANVTTRTAVMQKNDMVALLCLKTAPGGAAICRVDPREAQPAVQLYDDPAAAAKWFRRSLRTSRDNGWNVVYDGLPLQG